jgi:hypothetical protein
MFGALIIVFRLLTDPDRLCESLIFPASLARLSLTSDMKPLILRRKRCSLKKCCKDSGGI